MLKPDEIEFAKKAREKALAAVQSAAGELGVFVFHLLVFILCFALLVVAIVMFFLNPFAAGMVVVPVLIFLFATAFG